jgi:tight adherence protein B
MIDPMIAAAVGLTILLGAAFIASSVAQRRRRATRERLSTIVPTRTGAGDQPVSVIRTTAVGSNRLVLSGHLHERLRGLREATGGRLTLAGLVLASIVSAGTLLALTAGPMGLSPGLIASSTAGAAFAGPFALFRRIRGRFQREFSDEFPEAIDLMVRAVKAGLPAMEALSAAARDTADPVGEELRRVIDEMRIGVEMEDALLHAAERVRIADFRFFVVCLTLQRRTGGSLAETLGNLSTLIRKRKELRLKTRALTAEPKTSATVLSALPVLVGAGMFAFNPSYISVLFTDSRGRFILSLAVASIVTGFAVMNAIIKRSLR